MSTSINCFEIPDSTVQSATAAFYTIPAQRYAIMRAMVEGASATIAINGVVVLSSQRTTWSTMASSLSPRIVNHSTGNGMRSIAPIAPSSGSSAWQIPGSLNQVPAGSSTVGFLADLGDAFTNGTGADTTSLSQTFKLREGTTVAGAGTARYHIENYKIPGATI